MAFWPEKSESEKIGKNVRLLYKNIAIFRAKVKKSLVLNVLKN